MNWLFCWTCRLDELQTGQARCPVEPDTAGSRERHTGHEVTVVDDENRSEYAVHMLASRHFDITLRMRHADLKDLLAKP